MARTFSRNPAFADKRDEYARRNCYAERAQARSTKARAFDLDAMGFDDSDALAARPMRDGKARRFASRMLHA